MAKGIESAGSTSSRQVEPPREREVDTGNKQKEGASQKDDQQAQVDANPDVRNARGESNVDAGKKNQPVDINPAQNQVRTYSTEADAQRDNKELTGLSDRFPEAANSTYANLLKNEQATDEYKAEMARQVALSPGAKLNLTTLSQLQDPAQKEAVVGALRTANQAGVLDARSVSAANAPPKGDPTAVGSLWNAATHAAPGAPHEGAGAEEAEGAEGNHGVAETVASTGAGLAHSLEKSMEGPLSQLGSVDREVAQGAIKSLGAVFEGVESSMDFKEGMELMQQGRYGEGVAKLAQAGAAATPAIIGLMENGGFLRGMSMLTEKVPGGAMGAGTFIGGLARMLYGKDGNPDATDRTAGILKMGAGVLQAIPATTVPGTLMAIGVDIADETGLLRTAVEKTGQVLAPAGSAISRHMAELEQLQRDNPGVFIMPVGGGA